MNLKMDFMIYNSLIFAIGILLLSAGIIDIRKKQISRGLLLALMLVCFAVMPFKENLNIADTAGGLAIGLCAVGISVATREQIGKGDGMVIAAVGSVLGAHKCLLAVCVASFVMCVAAIVILLLKRGNKQTRLPFLPALFTGYVVCVIF